MPPWKKTNTITSVSSSSRRFLNLLNTHLPTKPSILSDPRTEFWGTFKTRIQCFSTCNTSKSPHEIGRNFEIQILHSKAIKSGSTQIDSVCSQILTLYVRKSNLGHARKVFDEMPNRDVYLWTVLIAGFARMGQWETALGLFTEMQFAGVRPNCFTLSCVLKCCGRIKNLTMGKEIHGWLLRNGVDLDVILENSMVDCYSKCEDFEYARKVFELMSGKDIVSCNIMINVYFEIGDSEKSLDLFRRMPFKDIASWNTIIVGQLQNGCHGLALELLYQMSEVGTVFSEVTYSIALVLAASLYSLELGRQIHSKILRSGLDHDLIIRNSLIDMYCKCGDMKRALKVFNIKLQNSELFCFGMLETTISWSSIVNGHVQNGSTEDALELFHKMVQEGVAVNQFTLTSATLACANAGIVEQGRQIHAFMEKKGLKLDDFLQSAIIDMYAKCGCLDDAQSIFYQSTSRNIVLWTSMISGCALHGNGLEAIRLFQLMLKEGITPNEISFIGILSGCSHSGLLEEGWAYFRSMQEEHGIVPRIEHFTCMVDLLGRAGCLNEAKEFIYENKISHQSSVWRALLSASQVHKNLEIAKLASDQLLKLDPLNESSYVLLSNICATTNRWKDAADMRSLMQERGVRKQPGQSWIRLKNHIHIFVAGDRSHPQAGEIYSYLEGLIVRLKEVGYSTDTIPVMHDVEEEQRELFLGFHSEKLAIAYGIMNTPCGSPVLVMKNLRTCVDCHTAIKCISLVTGRKITVRDTVRFHHFEQGHCSCGDYW